jgi:spermidine synthase
LAVLAGCRGAAAEDKLLFEKPSQFSTVVVTEDAAGLRTLWFDRNGVRQSVVKPGDPDHIELPYARAMPVGLALVEKPERMLIVGLGGGTLPSFFHKHYPRCKIDVVDIDPVVVEAAKQCFGFREDETLRAYVDDGRRFIARRPATYDLIFLDAFGSDSIPRHLATREFLGQVRKALTRDGLAAANVWGRSSNTLYESMVRTYQDAFDELHVIDVRGAGNKILLAAPRKLALARGELAERATRLSRARQWRFDVGEYVQQGLQDADQEARGGRILRDADEPAPQ